MREKEIQIFQIIFQPNKLVIKLILSKLLSQIINGPDTVYKHFNRAKPFIKYLHLIKLKNSVLYANYKLEAS